MAKKNVAAKIKKQKVKLSAVSSFSIHDLSSEKPHRKDNKKLEIYNKKEGDLNEFKGSDEYQNLRFSILEYFNEDEKRVGISVRSPWSEGNDAISPDHIINWIIERSNIIGFQNTYDEFIKWIKAREKTYYSVILIAGVSVEKTYSLFEGEVKISPLKDLIESDDFYRLKKFVDTKFRNILGVQIFDLPRWAPSISDGVIENTCVLFFEKSYKEHSEEEVNKYTNIENWIILINIILFIDPNVKLYDSIIFNFYKGITPLLANAYRKINSRILSPNEILSPFKTNYINQESINNITKISELIISKNLQQNKYHLAIKYLSSSKLENSLERKIVDLCIALEILLSKTDEQTEISFRLALRTALLLEKKDARNKIKKLYDIRSKIVHGDYKAIKSFSETKLLYNECYEYSYHSLIKLLEADSEESDFWEGIELKSI